MFSTYPSVFKLSSDDIINEIIFSESSFSFISWKELRFWVKVFFRFSRSGWLPLCLIVQSSSRIVSPELRSMSAGLGISPKSSKSVFNAQPKKQNENDKIKVDIKLKKYVERVK